MSRGQQTRCCCCTYLSVAQVPMVNRCNTGATHLSVAQVPMVNRCDIEDRAPSRLCRDRVAQQPPFHHKHSWGAGPANQLVPRQKQRVLVHKTQCRGTCTQPADVQFISRRAGHMLLKRTCQCGMRSSEALYVQYSYAPASTTKLVIREVM